MGGSVDSAEGHRKWKRDICAFTGAPAGLPIIDDSSLQVAKTCDMSPADTYLPGGHTPADSATAFTIGPDKKVRFTMVYVVPVSRTLAEVLRALDAIQATDGAPIATPAN
ncbi:MAG: alkyl hydroperoxide reductase subunit AhpC [Gammaproteobacteria bacterium]|jgi:alkyl hydroperoxide reductase subunit AhpC